MFSIIIYMRSAILGLRKRESYNELINDLNHDPIGKYPDRTASQIENSNYLSQLRGGFEQMYLQNENIMKQQQKEILLREEAGSQPHSHHEQVINENRWRHHVPPDEPMPEAEVFHTPLRVPVGEPQEYAPDRDTPLFSGPTRSRSNRKAKQRNSPMIEEVQPEPEVFQIGTPRSRSTRKGRKSKIAHDVDSEAEKAHEMMIDDEEMKAARDDELKEYYVETSRLMLQEAQNQEIEDIMTGRGDKRRDEGANPKPAQPKAKTAAWTQQNSRWTKDEPIPKAPPPKANSPETDHEPKGRPGRPPKNSPKAEPKPTPASSSTDTPHAKAQAKAAPPASSRSKAIPVKKEPKPKPKHETEKVVLDTYDEWFKKGIGFLMDQLSVRRLNYDIYFPNPPNPDPREPKKPKVKKPKKQHKPEVIEMLLKFDGKN